MQQPNLLKQILLEGAQKAIGESKVPFAVHQKLIKELGNALIEYKKLVVIHEKTLLLTDKERQAHTTQIASFETELERYRQLAKGDQGDRGNNGKDGKDGKDAEISNERLIALIEPLIPNVEDGKDAEVSDDLIEEMIDKVKKGLTVDSIKGLREFVSNKKKSAEGFTYNGMYYRFAELMHGGGGTSSGSITFSVDLSSQCDGVNKIFNVPDNSKFVQLSGSDAPQIYRPSVDYTGTGTNVLTLTSGVNAPSLGATLILLYVV